MKTSTAHAIHAVTLVVYVGSVVASLICSPGIGPVSQELGVLIQPPSWTFAGAWSAIYLLSLVFCIWQFFPRSYTHAWADIAVNSAFCVCAGLCALWIVAFSARLYALQALVVCVSALGMLAVSGILKYKGKNHAMRFSMNVFAAWLVLASVLGVMACVKAVGWTDGVPANARLVRDLDHSVEYCVALAVAILAEAALSAWLVCPGPSLVALWGLGGVGARLYAVPSPSAPSQAEGLRGLRLITICGVAVHTLSAVITSVVAGYLLHQEITSGGFSWASCSASLSSSSLSARPSKTEGSRATASLRPGTARSPAEGGSGAAGGPAQTGPLSGDSSDGTPLIVSETTESVVGSQASGRRKSPTELSADDKTPPAGLSVKGWWKSQGGKRGYAPVTGSPGAPVG